MNEKQRKTLIGEIIDETAEISVTELCAACSVEETLVERLVDEGVIEPVGGPDAPRFRHASVRRVRTVVRLQRDLGVNLAGAALAMDLLERIEDLRRRLRAVND